MTDTYYTLARWTETGNLWVSPTVYLHFSSPDFPALTELRRHYNRELRENWDGMPSQYEYFIAKVTKTETVERVE